MASREAVIDPAATVAVPAGCRSPCPPIDAFDQVSNATYWLLTGHFQRDAMVADDESFDRHVLASILAAAAEPDGAVAERAGLSAGELAALLARYFPTSLGARAVPGAAPPPAAAGNGSDEADDEITMVRDLLLAQHAGPAGSGPGGTELAPLLAAMIARRAMEPNHLWEDLGLRDRSELSRLMARHFAPLAARNTRNMRWKRFLYRMLCENDGFAMCSTPVCTQCSDFSLCFGDESGESRMADRRRTLALSDPTAGNGTPSL